MEVTDWEVEEAARHSNTWLSCRPFTGTPNDLLLVHHQLGQGEPVMLEKECQEHGGSTVIRPGWNLFPEINLKQRLK